MKINNQLYVCILLLFAVFLNCKSDKKNNTEEAIVDATNNIEFPTNVIEIVTRGMEFQCVDTIPSGWNTFKYENLSHETHFFLLDKYPEGKTVENTLTDIAPVFEKGMDLINEGLSLIHI